MDPESSINRVAHPQSVSLEAWNTCARSVIQRERDDPDVIHETFQLLATELGCSKEGRVADTESELTAFLAKSFSDSSEQLTDAQKETIYVIEQLYLDAREVAGSDEDAAAVKHYLSGIGQSLAKCCYRSPATAEVDQQQRLNQQLSEAVAQGDASKVRLFIAAGAELEQDDGPRTLLGMAVDAGDVEVLRVLLEAGAEPNVVDRKGSPLSGAAARGDLSAMKILVASGAQIDLPDGVGRTPLMYALQKGLEEAAQLLVDMGADTSAIKHQAGSLLRKAINGDNAKSMALLLKYGVDPNAVDGKGYTPLTRAAEAGKLKVIEALLDGGALPNLPDEQERTALALLARRPHAESLFGKLIDAGADPNCGEGAARLPLWIAASAGQLEVFSALLENGADALAQDERGRTVAWKLLHSTPLRYHDMLELLEERGIDVTATREVVAMGHAWHRDGKYNVAVSDSASSDVVLEGGTRWFNEMVAVNQQLQDRCPTTEGRVMLEGLSEAMRAGLAVRTRSDLDSAVATIKGGSPLFIRSGYDIHAVQVLIWGDMFVMCNRGGASRNPVEVFRFDPELLDAGVLDDMLKVKSKSERDFRQLYHRDLQDRLNLQETSLTSMIQDRCTLPYHMVGNCTWVSDETGAWAFFALAAARRTLGMDENDGVMSDSGELDSSEESSAPGTPSFHEEIAVENKEVLLDALEVAAGDFRRWLAAQRLSTIETVVNKMAERGSTPDHNQLMSFLRQAWVMSSYVPEADEQLDRLEDKYLSYLWIGEPEMAQDFMTQRLFWRTLPNLPIVGPFFGMVRGSHDNITY